MSLLRKRSLPEIPAPAEQHPDLQTFQRQLAQFTSRVDAARAELARLEVARNQTAAALTEDRIAEALAEDPDAGARVTAARLRLTDLEARLADARDSLSIQEEAARRFAQRESSIRAGITAQIEADVASVYRALTAQLADALAAVMPVNERLLKLQRQHGTSPALADAVWWNELSPQRFQGNANKAMVWLAHIQTLGVTFKT